MLALVVAAVSLGLDNFAAAVGIGLSGVTARTRLQVALVFGAFESGMPLVGLVLGAQVAGPIGDAARPLGAGLLIALGCYGLLTSARDQPGEDQPGEDQPGEDQVGEDQAGEDQAGEDQAGEHRARAPQPAPQGTARLGGVPRILVDAGDRLGADPRRRRSAGYPLVLTGLALSLDNLVVGFALGAYHASVVAGAVIIGVVSVTLTLIGLELGSKVARWVGPRGEQLAGVVLIALGIAIAAGAIG